MLTIFSFNDSAKTLIITLVPNTLEGIKLESNEWSTRVTVKTSHSFNLPCKLKTTLGILTLQAIHKNGEKSLQVPASEVFTNDDGTTGYKGIPVLATIVPADFGSYMQLLNARIFGVYESLLYQIKQQTANNIAIPAMSDPKSLKLTPSTPPAVPAIPALVGSMSLANGVTNSAEDSAVPKAPVDDLPF